MIRINDIFHTFQGEGQNWGRRALFVRMPFCNLKCEWCDTEFNTFEKWSAEMFELKALEEATRFAVLTGGEPMVNKDSKVVIGWLKTMGFEIACETNGTFPILDGIDFVTVSPKREADYFIHPEVEHRISELKIVLDNGFDFSVLHEFDQRFKINPYVRLTLSPEFGNMKESVKLIESYIKENPRWRMSLQTHKWIGVK